MIVCILNTFSNCFFSSLDKKVIQIACSLNVATGDQWVNNTKRQQKTKSKSITNILAKNGSKTNIKWSLFMNVVCSDGLYLFFGLFYREFVSKLKIKQKRLSNQLQIATNNPVGRADQNHCICQISRFDFRVIICQKIKTYGAATKRLLPKPKLYDFHLKWMSWPHRVR